jgi:GxxExxY protein
MNENELSKIIVDCIKVHKNIGPGLLESAYEECLFYELSRTGLLVERQKPLPLFLKLLKWKLVIDWIF